MESTKESASQNGYVETYSEEGYTFEKSMPVMQ